MFHHIARTVCTAGCLPRKELYESWEVARRVRRRFRGGRVVDLACGHALVAQMMVLIDKSCTGALAVDRRIPPSAQKVFDVLAAEWPVLEEKVEIVEASLGSVELAPTDVVVSAHACGDLTDQVLTLAIAAGARVAVLPCCHQHDKFEQTGLEGWLDRSLAIDVERAERMRRAGYRVHTHVIPETITPKNRLLLGQPNP